MSSPAATCNSATQLPGSAGTAPDAATSSSERKWPAGLWSHWRTINTDRCGNCVNYAAIRPRHPDGFDGAPAAGQWNVCDRFRFANHGIRSARPRPSSAEDIPNDGELPTTHYQYQSVNRRGMIHPNNKNNNNKDPTLRINISSYPFSCLPYSSLPLMVLVRWPISDNCLTLLHSLHIWPRLRKLFN